MRILGIAVLGIAAVLSARQVHAAAEECNEAISAYNSALSDVSDALKRYTRCLSSGARHDDCSSEFRKLKNAQSDFEAAVSQHEIECN
jgi:hypothetical protein